jgi:hypothetical protein
LIELVPSVHVNDKIKVERGPVRFAVDWNVEDNLARQRSYQDHVETEL